LTLEVPPPREMCLPVHRASNRLLHPSPFSIFIGSFFGSSVQTLLIQFFVGICISSDFWI